MTQTFVYRRWHTGHRAYVDLENAPIPLKVVERKIFEITRPFGPSTPPADGSSPFLRLPTELRLHVYDYLTVDDPNKWIYQWTKAQSATQLHTATRYAYLYRSPGRITKPNGVSPDFVKLLQINQQIRNDILDACFNDRTFVLEASLYQDTVAGLLPLPKSLMPSGWVKRLLILTVVEVGGKCKGIADLRPLQQMVNLRHVRIIPGVRDRRIHIPPFDGKGQPSAKAEVSGERLDNPILAVVECIPPTANVQVDTDSGVKDELRPTFGYNIEYLFKEPMTDAVAESMKTDLGKFRRRQGRLSRSHIDHTRCFFGECKEGLECVNSTCGH